MYQKFKKRSQKGLESAGSFSGLGLVGPDPEKLTLAEDLFVNNLERKGVSTGKTAGCPRAILKDACTPVFFVMKFFRSFNPFLVFAIVFSLAQPIGFLTVELLAATTQFSDLTPGSRYYTAVMDMKAHGIMNGYPDGTVRVDQDVNRAEIIKMTFLGLNIQGSSYYIIPTFSDLDPLQYYWGPIVTAYTYKVVHGYSDNTFRPGQTVNLAEAWQILFLSVDLQYPNALDFSSPQSQNDVYHDTPLAEWFSKYAQVSKDLHLVDPDAQGKVYPGQDISRGEFAEMLYRLRKYLMSSDPEAAKELSQPIVVSDITIPGTTGSSSGGSSSIPTPSSTSNNNTSGLSTATSTGSSSSTSSSSTSSTTNTTSSAGNSSSGTTGSTSTSSSASTSGGLTYNNSLKIGNCPVFSDQYPFNQRVDDLVKYPVLANSSSMMKNMGLTTGTFLFSNQSIDTTIVTDAQPLLPLICDPYISWCQSTLIPQVPKVPYPPDLDINEGNDHHALIIHETSGGPLGVVPKGDTTPPPGEKNCYAYESWWTGRLVNNAAPTPQPNTEYVAGSNVTGFSAGSLAIFDLKRDINYVPDQIPGNSASNISLLTGTVRYDEAATDSIHHALMIAVAITRYGYIYPANSAQIPLNCSGTPTNQNDKAIANFNTIKQFPCDLYNVNLPAMGQRFRLKSTFDETPYKNYPFSLSIIHALKKYGFIVTDGTFGLLAHLDNDSRWQNVLWPDIAQLQNNLTVQDFEVIDLEKADTKYKIVDLPPTTKATNNPNSTVYN